MSVGAFEPKLLAFLCNWCSYAVADLAGVSRFQYHPTIRVLRTMCSGRVDPLYLTEGLKSGFDGVFVFGCHIGDCHYLEGNVYAQKRMLVVEDLLDMSKIDRGRVRPRWVSAAGSRIFDPSRLDSYHYADHPNVVSSLEFERILSASGENTCLTSVCLRSKARRTCSFHRLFPA